MKSKSIISTGRFFRFFALAVVILAAACTKGQLDGEGPEIPGVQGGMAHIALYTNAGEYQTPVSRAGADENNALGSMPWVFVFLGNDDNAVFAEVKQAFLVGTGNIPYVMLTHQPSAVRLLIIANAPPAYFDGTTDNIPFTEANLVSTLTAGGAKTLAEASVLLNTTKLAPIQTTVPYAGGYLPMSGIYDMAGGISSSTTSIGTAGSGVDLIRSLSKVTIENTAATFTISSATVAKVKQFGRLYQSAPVSYISDNTVSYAADIVSAVSESTAASPIYIYESASGESSAVVRGIYNGTLYYYRLAFKNPIDNSIMNIDRNKWYKFKITAVRGDGFSTFNQALAEPPSNNLIDYALTVTDLNSYDMMDNGLYYMGFSNSELLFYGLPPDTEQLTAAIVTTNASSSMLEGINSVTVSGEGLTLVSPGSQSNLSSDGITTAVNEIKITVSSTFVSGQITVKLGNLTKIIILNRVSAYPLSFTGTIEQMSYHTGDQYTSATIDDSAFSWLSLSTDGRTSVGNEFTQPDAGSFLPIYLLPEKNIGMSGMSMRSTEGVYLTRRNGGKVKVFVRQDALNTGTITPTPITNSYVGTFHRWNETGERVIRMNNAGDGAWSAMVVAGDFIILDTETLGRTNTGDNTALTGDNAEDFQVTGDATSVSGSGSRIYFRIGMTGNLPGGSADAAPRYGLILVTYNNNTQYHLIYVRQGEAADYLMRNIAEDNPKTGPMAGVQRTLAAKFSTYNLTDPQKVTGTDPIDRGTRGYTFTDFPSQSGYHFQWYLTLAWDPCTTGPVTLNDPAIRTLWNTAWETCPAGYRRPDDGSTTEFVETHTANDSELRQSLYLNPQNAGVNNLNNSVWGYLADGFFDRKTIGTSVNNFENSTAGSGTDIAYIGRLFYNPNNNASVFFPSTGFHGSIPASLWGTGILGYYWLSTSYSEAASVGGYMHFYDVILNQNSTSRIYAFSLRCVKE